MAAPTSAPSIENIAAQDNIDSLLARIEKLEAIIDLYLAPNEYIFAEEEDVRAAARKAVSRKIEKEHNAIGNIPEILADVQEMNGKLDTILRKRKPGDLLEKRLKRTDDLLVARKNEPIPFTEMKRLQEFKPIHARQDMTKLGHVYEQYPEKYEVRDSSLGGKTVKLVRDYFNHLTKGGV
jgi:hypothetical protein